MIKPSYQELALAIANHVYQNWYQLDPDGLYSKGLPHVDDYCDSGRQIPTGVLERLGVLDPIGESQSRYDFSCAPEAFPAVIEKNKKKGCSYDVLVLALICIAKTSSSQQVEDLLNQLNVLEYEPGGRIRETELYAEYNKLYEDWPARLRSGRYEESNT